MDKMLTQITVTVHVLALLIIGIEFVNSAPIDSGMGSSGAAAVTIPKWIAEMLTDVSDTATALYSVYKNTDFFEEKELFKPECKCREQKACMGVVFTHNYTKDSISNLTYSQLTDYYNEFVLQLKLAEHNIEVAIDLEIKESRRSESMEMERNIIRSLNESILPTLEFMLNITQSEANCPATKVIADLMISFYTNCASCLAVNSSNASLQQMAINLFEILENQISVFVDSIAPTPIAVDSSKKWCMIL